MQELLFVTLRLEMSVVYNIVNEFEWKIFM